MSASNVKFLYYKHLKCFSKSW